MGEKVINAALLGLGTVGTGVYKVLKNQEEEMTAKIGCKVKIRKILVRNLEKAAGKVDDPAVLTNSWEDIKADPSIDIIIDIHIRGLRQALRNRTCQNLYFGCSSRRQARSNSKQRSDCRPRKRTYGHSQSFPCGFSL